METVEITQGEAKQMVKGCNGNKFFTVEFVKRSNGENRIMNCRKNVRKGTRGGALSFDPVAKDLVSVFDIPKGQHRFISLDEIKSVRMSGKRYIVKS